MKSVTRRKYSKEFKLETINLVLEGGKSQAQICRDLGLSEQVLSRWMREYKAASARAEAAFPGKGKQSPTDQRIKDLEAQVRRLTMERDILKKATAYFAKLPE